jgi:hypothetical protein
MGVQVEIRWTILSRDQKDQIYPFVVEHEWFVIDFDTLIIKPSPRLGHDLRAKIRRTIDILRLNTDPDLRNERIE